MARQRGLIWLAGLLLISGEVAAAIVGSFHAGGAKANDHAAVFKQYAESDSWTAVHVLLFMSALLIVAGVVVLARAAAQSERGRSLAVLIAVSAAVSAAASGLVLAVDGVALKQTVDAWVNAVPAQKAFAFHDAEVVRWLEWGANSFLAAAEGLTYLLLGWAIVRTARVPKWIGWLSALAGPGLYRCGIFCWLRRLHRHNLSPRRHCGSALCHRVDHNCRHRLARKKVGRAAACCCLARRLASSQPVDERRCRGT